MSAATVFSMTSRVVGCESAAVLGESRDTLKRIGFVVVSEVEAPTPSVTLHPPKAITPSGTFSIRFVVTGKASVRDNSHVSFLYPDMETLTGAMSMLGSGVEFNVAKSDGVTRVTFALPCGEHVELVALESGEKKTPAARFYDFFMIQDTFINILLIIIMVMVSVAVIAYLKNVANQTVRPRKIDHHRHPPRVFEDKDRPVWRQMSSDATDNALHHTDTADLEVPLDRSSIINRIMKSDLHHLRTAHGL